MSTAPIHPPLNWSVWCMLPCQILAWSVGPYIHTVAQPSKHRQNTAIFSKFYCLRTPICTLCPIRSKFGTTEWMHGVLYGAMPNFILISLPMPAKKRQRKPKTSSIKNFQVWAAVSTPFPDQVHIRHEKVNQWFSIQCKISSSSLNTVTNTGSQTANFTNFCK